MAEPEEIAVPRQLVAAFPVPDGSWHGFADEIAACRDDLAAAIEAIDGDEPALAALQALLESGSAAPPSSRPELAAAAARLEALPAPEGRHPFVDDILPALEAMHAGLAAVAAGPAASSAVARRRAT
jgi:hypothetical protein